MGATLDSSALVNGKYAQTKHCLHNGEGYDGLGVLADISGLGYYSSVPMEEGDELRPRGFLLYDNSDKAAPCSRPSGCRCRSVRREPPYRIKPLPVWNWRARTVFAPGVSRRIENKTAIRLCAHELHTALTAAAAP